MYDGNADVDYTLDASGRKTDFEYDALGNLLTIRQGPIAAQVTTLTNTYESGRQLVWKRSDALANETEFVYDAAHRVREIYDPLRRRTQIAYRDDARPDAARSTSTTSPLAAISTTLFDNELRTTAQSDAEGRTIDYEFDKDGVVTLLANRLNQPFTWTQSYSSNQSTFTSKTPRQQPNGPDATRSTVAIRNTRGLLASATEPSGQSTTFTSYNAQGWLTEKTDGVGTTSYTYWPNGLLKGVTENGRTTYRGYDELNRLNEYRDGEGNTLRYDYYPSGELKEITYPGGTKKVVYHYDDFGRLWKVVDWNNRQTTYSYDNASRLTRIDRPNGTYRVQEYDAASQLRFIKDFRGNGTILLFQELRYDDDGRITYTFVHPRSALFNVPLDTMTYDVDNRLATWNETTTTVDFDGNMTYGPLPSGTMGSYTYDSRNRLTAAGGSNYRYNPDGHRVEITGSYASQFVIDPNAELSRTLVRTKAGQTTYYVYGASLLYEETNGWIKTYHFNQVGSTLMLTDGNGNETDRMGYSPFGTLVERTGTTDTPFLFNGEFGVITDGNCSSALGTTTGNGLVYMRARYYNPRLMRFLNADPIGFDGGLNWYAFTNNNPVGFLDPTGLERATQLPAVEVVATRTRWEAMRARMTKLRANGTKVMVIVTNEGDEQKEAAEIVGHLTPHYRPEKLTIEAVYAGSLQDWSTIGEMVDGMVIAMHRIRDGEYWGSEIVVNPIAYNSTPQGLRDRGIFFGLASISKAKAQIEQIRAGGVKASLLYCGMISSDGIWKPSEQVRSRQVYDAAKVMGNELRYGR